MLFGGLLGSWVGMYDGGDLVAISLVDSFLFCDVVRLDVLNVYKFAFDLLWLCLD